MFLRESKIQLPGNLHNKWRLCQKALPNSFNVYYNTTKMKIIKLHAFSDANKSGKVCVYNCIVGKYAPRIAHFPGTSSKARLAKKTLLSIPHLEVVVAAYISNNLLKKRSSSIEMFCRQRSCMVR